MINTPCVSFASLFTIHPIFPARTRPPDTMGKLGGEQGTLLVAYISNQLLKQGQQHSRWVQIFVGIIEKWRHEYLSCTLYFNQPSGKTTLRTHLAASIRSHLVGQAATLSGWTGTTFRCLLLGYFFHVAGS